MALENLSEEGFNAQATATLATLAPREYRKPVVEAIVGLQIIYDYLDSLIERPLADQLSDSRQLYGHSLTQSSSTKCRRATTTPDPPKSDDGGYLEELVGVVRRALTRLPSQATVAEACTQAAERCAEAQAHAHATTVLGSTHLEQWAKSNAHNTGLQWREFLAGAVSSGLSLHALIATAADPVTTQEQARAVDEVYLSICALTTLLDGLIDYEQDMRSMGHPDTSATTRSGCARPGPQKRAPPRGNRSTQHPQQRSPSHDAGRCRCLLRLSPDCLKRVRTTRHRTDPPGTQTADHADTQRHACLANANGAG